MKIAKKFFILPILAVSAAAAQTSCAVYNEECARFMENPEGVAGYLAGDISITRSEVRLRDNPIGQVVADSFYNAFTGRQNLPDAAIANGGSIREDGLCEARPTLQKGVLKRKTLRDILPYDNRVLLTSVSYKGLKDILEHGVASYSTLVPPGAYLQVSGIKVVVDCSYDPEQLDASGRKTRDGSRVQSIRFRVRDCIAEDSDACYGEPIDLTDDSTKIYLALDSFLFDGGDNFSGFGAELDALGSYNFDVVAKYFSETYTEESPLSATPEERVVLLNCD